MWSKSLCRSVLLGLLWISGQWMGREALFVDRAFGDAPSPSDDTVRKVSYYREVLPIFRAQCQGCHQPAKRLGEFDMTSFSGLVQGGESGEKAIVPGQPDESSLVRMITPVDGKAEMPKRGQPLSETQLALIRTWIAQGGTDDTPAASSQTYSVDHPPKYTRLPVITALDISPDGQHVAVSGFHEVLIHRKDGTTSQLEARLIGMSERIESIEFSPDGTRIAVAGGSPGRSGELQVWDLATKTLQFSLPLGFDSLYGVSWSPDQKTIAFGCSDSTVRAVDSTDGHQVLYQGSHTNWVFDTIFSADGSHLVSVSADMTSKLIEVGTQRFVDNITSITPKALKGGINSVARHPLRDEVLFGGADGVPRIYRMHRIAERKIGDDANLLWELAPLPGRIFSVDVSRDGAVLAAGSSLNGKGTVQTYRIDPNYQVPTPIQEILVKPTYSRSADENSRLQAYFRDGIKTLASVPIDASVYAVSLSPDGTLVAAAGSDGHVRFVSTADGTIVYDLAPVPLDGPVAADTVQPDQTEGPAAAVPLPSEVLPANLKISKLRSLPESIELCGSRETVQLLVTADLDSGATLDVTRQATYVVPDQLVDMAHTGRLTPRKNGAGMLVATIGEQRLEIPIRVTEFGGDKPVDYVRDIMPIVSRMGCNAGTCHGAKDGKNGFKLSLRGYDPIYDIRALTDDLGSRRVNVASPDHSLMLLKCTASVPHQGGQVTTVGSSYYTILRDWISAGATVDLSSARVRRIEVFPQNPTIERIGMLQQMRVVATYADDSQRDVTRESFIESGNTDVAKPVDGHIGLMAALRRGEAPVLVRFEGAYAATTVMVMGDRKGFQWQEPPKNNEIDSFVAQKLARTKTLPSPLCDDYEFIRRAYLDLTGLPPTAAEIRGFVADNRDSRWKRDELIDRLVGSAEYVEHWANKWADLLQVNSKFLGVEGATAFRHWIRDQVATNVPYDEFARRILTASGSNKENPPASYFKILRTPQDAMENTTHLFLATRFNCNKCHDHPFERWTQDQYYQLSAFFAQIGLKADPNGGDKMIGGTAVESGKPLYEVVLDLTEGEVQHERTGEVSTPHVPYPATTSASPQGSDNPTRRQQLAAWITASDNQYFARSYVNRLWGYLTGTGIIEPIDDIRAGNPPSNPELLDWLTRQFVESGFNTQHIVRLICKSRTYQLSVATNPWNADDQINYSHAKARRLPAEVLYDSIQRVTGSQSQFPGLAKGTRAAALPDISINLPDGFLANLGRPVRESACECERSNDLQLGPVMALVSGPTLGESLVDSSNDLYRLVQEFPDDRALFDELFLRILNRPATSSELDAAVGVINSLADEHANLEKDLAQLERQWAPKYATLEAERWTRIAAAERELAAYQEQQRPQLERAMQDRERRITDSEKALEEYVADLDLHQLEWEHQDQLATEWSTMEFESLQSTQGAILERQPDGSIFVSGNQGRGNYELSGDTFRGPVTGIRIEALTDSRLPQQGPGRADDGNFVLSELKASWADIASSQEAEIATWKFEQDLSGWSGNDQVSLQTHDGQLAVVVAGSDPMLYHDVAAEGAVFVLDVEAKVDGPAESQLYWKSKSHTEYSEDKSVRLTLGGTGEWLHYRYYFRSGEALTALRWDPDTKANRCEIRSIRLDRVESPKFTDVKFRSARADVSQQGYDVTTAIDGQNPDNGNGWAISPEMGKAHQAIFEFDQPINLPQGVRWKLSLQQNFNSTKHSLGRFRVSLTSSRTPLDFGLPAEIRTMVDITPNARTSDQKQKLRDYFAAHDPRKLQLEQTVAQAKQPLPIDPRLVEREQGVAEAKREVPVDPPLVRMRAAVAMSAEQLKNKRLTAVQDVCWALINNPSFLFNR